MVTMDTPYAIVGPDNKALNFITWNGVNEFDYGQAEGNYLVSLEGIQRYGFGWLYDAASNTFINPEPVLPPTNVQVISGVQEHIDKVAQSVGYDDGVALVSYVPSTVEPWRNEADTFVPWRDSVWTYTFDTIAKIDSGEIPPPASVEEFVSWLPPIVWPTA